MSANAHTSKAARASVVSEKVELDKITDPIKHRNVNRFLKLIKSELSIDKPSWCTGSHLNFSDGKLTVLARRAEYEPSIARAFLEDIARIYGKEVIWKKHTKK